MCSPRNIASRRSSTPRSRASSPSSISVSSVIRFFEKSRKSPAPSATRRSPRSGSAAKRSRRCAFADLGEVGLQAPPGGRLAQRTRGAGAHPAVTPRLSAIVFSSSSQDLSKLVFALVLEPLGERREVDPGPFELFQHLLGVAAGRVHQVADLAVVGEGLERLVGHRVDRERRGEGLDVERVGGVRVLGPGARPEQALRRGRPRWRGASSGPSRAARGRRGRRARRSRSPSRFFSSAGTSSATATSQRRHEDRGDRGDDRVEPGLDPPFDALHVGVGGGEVLLVVEEQRDVDRDAGEDRLLDRLGARRGAGDLDEEVLALGLGVERRGLLDRRRGVVGEQRRDLEADEAVDPGGARVDVGEEVGGVAQVGERELEEDVLLGVGAGAVLVLGRGR